MTIKTLKSGLKVMIIQPNEVEKYLTPEDKDMDERCREAIEMAIRKANFLKNRKFNFMDNCY